MTPMKWFYSFLKKYRGRMLLGLLFMTGISILAIVNPYISGIIVDRVIKQEDYSMLTNLILCLIGVTVIRGILRFLSQLLFEDCSQGMLYHMREHVYKRLLQQDFAFYNRNRTGDLMSRQTGDMDAIRHFVAYVVYAVYENVLLFIFAIAMIFTVNLKLALCMVILLPFAAVTIYLQSKSVKPAFHEIRKQFSKLNTFVQENISGNRVVKAFAKEDYELSKFNKENDAFREAELNCASIWMKYVPIFEFFSTVLTVVLILVGGVMVIRSEMTLGNLVTVSGYLWMLTNPVRMSGWLINDIQRFITSVEKIYTTISEEPNIKKPEKAINRRILDGNIEFKNVSYSVQGEDILDDVSFRVKKGQTIGIIGATGAGKSTIMNLLCRFYDVTDGEVLVDGINVKDLNLYDLRDNIGMAMQDVFLFSDTIEGNIAYGNTNCSFEEVKEAAIAANADDFIRKMPEGYNTIVGERGMGLSGGQKQRIALARALLKNPSVIILDDTTSAVDMETETRIQKKLNNRGNVHTTFIIAHRISSVKDADQILVMENGRIIESGKHNQLMKQNGYYATVFNHQYGEFHKYGIGGVVHG